MKDGTNCKLQTEGRSTLQYQRYLPTCLFLAATTLFTVPATAEIVSDWSQTYGARTRLIAGATFDGNVAGIQIELEDGWKTYWRNPGDGGIPPVFNWSGSQNLSNAEVLFPTPTRYQDSYGTSMGYQQLVVFPIALQVIDPNKPVLVRLKLDYAVCEKLCVPAQADLSLEIPANLSIGYSAGIQNSLDQVPTPRGTEDARIESMQVTTAEDKSWFEVTARFPGQPGELDLFVEGPRTWYLPAPVQFNRAQDGQDTLVGYRIDLSGVPKDASLEGARFLFTIIADAQAVEQQWIFE